VGKSNFLVDKLRTGISYYSKFAGWVDKIARTGMVIFICACACFMFVQVILRYMFDLGVDWLEESARYAGAISTLLALSPLTRTDTYLRIDMFYDKIKNCQVLYLLLDLFLIVCFGVMIFNGNHLVEFGMKQLTPALRVPFGYVYFFVPLGGILGLIQVVDRRLSLLFKVFGEYNHQAERWLDT
jgi:TRAP-type C4-dicarboxylate transport system permease small subunit